MMQNVMWYVKVGGKHKQTHKKHICKQNEQEEKIGIHKYNIC